MTHDHLFSAKVPENVDFYWWRVTPINVPEPIWFDAEAKNIYRCGKVAAPLNSFPSCQFGPALTWPPTQWEMRRVEGPPPPGGAAYFRLPGEQAWQFAHHPYGIAWNINIVEHIPMPSPPAGVYPLTDAQLDALAAQGGDAARAVEELRKLREKD